MATTWHVCQCGRKFRTASGLGLHWKHKTCRKPGKKGLEEMSVMELFQEADRVLKRNAIAIERVERQVAILARSLNCHLEEVKRREDPAGLSS